MMVEGGCWAGGMGWAWAAVESVEGEGSVEHAIDNEEEGEVKDEEDMRRERKKKMRRGGRFNSNNWV